MERLIVFLQKNKLPKRSIEMPFHHSVWIFVTLCALCCVSGHSRRVLMPSYAGVLNDPSSVANELIGKITVSKSARSALEFIIVLYHGVFDTIRGGMTDEQAINAQGTALLFILRRLAPANFETTYHTKPLNILELFVLAYEISHEEESDQYILGLVKGVSLEGRKKTNLVKNLMEESSYFSIENRDQRDTTVLYNDDPLSFFFLNQDLNLFITYPMHFQHLIEEILVEFPAGRTFAHIFTVLLWYAFVYGDFDKAEHVLPLGRSLATVLTYQFPVHSIPRQMAVTIEESLIVDEKRVTSTMKQYWEKENQEITPHLFFAPVQKVITNTKDILHFIKIDPFAFSSIVSSAMGFPEDDEIFMQILEKVSQAMHEAAYELRVYQDNAYVIFVGLKYAIDGILEREENPYLLEINKFNSDVLNHLNWHNPRIEKLAVSFASKFKKSFESFL